MDKDEYYYIGCAPIKTYQTPPPDQPGCVAEYCSSCGVAMWVSFKKRALQQNLPPAKTKIVCLDCLTKLIYISEEIVGKEVKQINLK